ncbi:DUF507 family protein [Candidatus Nitrospira bockiana]
MKLSKGRVHRLSESLAAGLAEKGHLDVRDRTGLVQALEAAITEELSVEDRLNAEVRALMKQYDAQIERGGVDYQKMFTMIKSKLVRERGLIL